VSRLYKLSSVRYVRYFIKCHHRRSDNIARNETETELPAVLALAAAKALSVRPSGPCERVRCCVRSSGTRKEETGIATAAAADAAAPAAAVSAVLVVVAAPAPALPPPFHR